MDSEGRRSPPSLDVGLLGFAVCHSHFMLKRISSLFLLSVHPLPALGWLVVLQIPPAQKEKGRGTFLRFGPLRPVRWVRGRGKKIAGRRESVTYVHNVKGMGFVHFELRICRKWKLVRFRLPGQLFSSAFLLLKSKY